MTPLSTEFIAMMPGQTPIEKTMDDFLASSLPKSVVWAPEVPISTDGGNYRADFVISTKATRLVIECDGADFHEFFRDRVRDVRMLQSGRIEEKPFGFTDVLRFRGCDLVYEPDACFGWIKTFFPNVFHAETPPPTAADKLLASIGMKAVKVQPILRSIVDTKELSGIAISTACMSVIGGGEHKAILQFKSPYWRKPL